MAWLGQNNAQRYSLLRASAAVRTDMAKVTFQAYYRALLAATDDAPLTFGSIIVTGVRTQLEKAAADFAALDSIFPSVGSYEAVIDAKRWAPAQAEASIRANLLNFAKFGGARPSPASLPQRNPQQSGDLVGFREPNVAYRNMAAISAMALAKRLRLQQ